MLTATASFAQTIDGTEIEVAAALAITLPGVAQTDFTLALKSINFDTQDTTSFPDDLTDKSGYTDTAGTVVLAGPADPANESLTMVGLLNPDDPSSVLYRQQVKGSPLTFDFGVVPVGQPKEMLRRITGRVQSFLVDVAAGTVTVQFIDLTGDWDQLPALPAVIIEEPYNAGLTSEFVLDRIARAASDGAVSSWPARRAGCILAVGFRSSVWPEVGGVLQSQPYSTLGEVVTYLPGVFGSAASDMDTIWTTGASTPADDVRAEWWATNLIAADYGSLLIGLGNPSLEDYILLGITTTGATTSFGFSLNAAPGSFTSHTITFSSLAAGAHHVVAHVHWPQGSTSYTLTVTIDGVAQSFSGSIGSPRATGFSRVTGIVKAGATIEALQVTTEVVGAASNLGFVPQAVLDPSLNPLQAVPAIDEGAQAWDEIQMIVTAEGGYASRDNLGRLIFLNRDTILNQAPARAIKVGVSLKSIQAQVGAATEYDDIAIDYTEWAAAAAAAVFSPLAKWKIPAKSTQSWIRTLPDGLTVALVDGSISVLPNSTDPDDGNSWFRASKDKFGNLEHGPNVSGTVRALTPSTVEITFTNDGSTDAWLVTPSNYTDVAAGTPALWIGGIPVAPDDPTTVHVSYGDAKPTYTVPANQYRQDRDAALGFGAVLLKQLHRAKPNYPSLAIVPDARVVVPDKVTLDLPLADGSVEEADVLVWGLSFGADFEQKSWEMSLDVRRVAPPGAWLLGTAGASELGDGASVTGTAWLY